MSTVDFEETEFKTFANLLFSQHSAPRPNSMMVDLQSEDEEDFTSFVNDLFYYGFQKKFNGIPLNKICDTHFQEIREYILALGVDTQLKGYDKNTQGEITRVKLIFKPYYPCSLI